MTQYLVVLPGDHPAGDALRFCLNALPDAESAGSGQVRLRRSGVDIWNESGDETSELHVALHERSKEGLRGLGLVLFQLTERYGRVTWVLED